MRDTRGILAPMTCCCGRYLIEQILLDRGHGPRQVIKVTMLGYLVGYYTDVEEVARVLADAGVAL